MSEIRIDYVYFGQWIVGYILYIKFGKGRFPTWYDIISVFTSHKYTNNLFRKHYIFQIYTFFSLGLALANFGKTFGG